MRIVTCAPILALCAAALFSQTPPNCNDAVNRTGVTALHATRPMPECVLCEKLSAPVRQTGANRIPIYRAIRALGSRIFPGNQPDRSRANTLLMRRFWRGSDFRLVLGKNAASPPCPAPDSRIQ